MIIIIIVLWKRAANASGSRPSYELLDPDSPDFPGEYHMIYAPPLDDDAPSVESGPPGVAPPDSPGEYHMIYAPPSDDEAPSVESGPPGVVAPAPAAPEESDDDVGGPDENQLEELAMKMLKRAEKKRKKKRQRELGRLSPCDPMGGA